MGEVMRTALVGVAIVATSLMWGCSSRTDYVVTTSGDVKALVAASNDSGGDASLTGTVTLGPDGCWSVLKDDGQWEAIIWPAGSALRDDDRLVLPGVDGAFAEGDGVVLAGGEVSVAGVEEETCLDASEVAFVAWQARR